MDSLKIRMQETLCLIFRQNRKLALIKKDAENSFVRPLRGCTDRVRLNFGADINLSFTYHLPACGMIAS